MPVPGQQECLPAVGIVAEVTATWQSLPRGPWDRQPSVVPKQQQISARCSLELTEKGEPSGKQGKRGPYHFGVMQESVYHCRCPLSCSLLRWAVQSQPPQHYMFLTEWKCAVSPKSLDCTPTRKELSHMGSSSDCCHFSVPAIGL